MVDQDAILGEPHTGYENEKGLGEFECENCKYYRRLSKTTGSCSEKNMVRYSQQPLTENKLRLVEAEGCCEYVHRVGRRDLVQSAAELKGKYWGKKSA